MVVMGIMGLAVLPAQAASVFSQTGTSSDHHVSLSANLTAGVTYIVTFTCTDTSGTGLDSIQSMFMQNGASSFSASGCGAGVNQTFTPTVTGSFNIDLHIHTNESTCNPLCHFSYGVDINEATVVALPVEVALPTPPPVASCNDVNFDVEGMVRTHFTNDADKGSINCRVIANDGHYENWFGAQVTFPSMVGSTDILKLGVIGAVDVFSPSGVKGFMGDVDICLKGSGYMIYMNANNSPRFPQLWSAWTTDAFPGYTCTTLYAPGTVILVTNHP